MSVTTDRAFDCRDGDCKIASGRRRAVRKASRGMRDGALSHRVSHFHRKSGRLVVLGAGWMVALFDQAMVVFTEDLQVLWQFATAKTGVCRVMDVEAFRLSASSVPRGDEMMAQGEEVVLFAISIFAPMACALFRGFLELPPCGGGVEGFLPFYFLGFGCSGLLHGLSWFRAHAPGLCLEACLTA